MSALIADKYTRCLSDSIEDYPEGIVIPVDKPYRWTSADVIRKIKFAACRHFGKKNLKVGHAGTLDPLATGVLLVCIGKACRMAEEFQKRDKEYVAGITFGATTPSYDLEKEIDRMYPTDGVSEETLKAVLPSFEGEQEQIAPLFSAKSVDGVRAYELARREYRRSMAEGKAFDHIDTELLSRQKICISAIELLSFEPGRGQGDGCCNNNSSIFTAAAGNCSADNTIVGNKLSIDNDNKRNARIHVTDNSALGLPRADIRVECSKGTYIRALARDIGEALGSGAHLDSLRRTRNGGFGIENALSVDEAAALFRFSDKGSS